MSAHMKKRHISKSENYIYVKYQGNIYQFPMSIAKKYQVSDDSIDTDTVFAEVNEKYTKPGALLRGLRVRENLTQVEMAEKLEVTQSDISQMENGARKIGRAIAQRIAELFDVNYRSFLD